MSLSNDPRVARTPPRFLEAAVDEYFESVDLYLSREDILLGRCRTLGLMIESQAELKVPTVPGLSPVHRWVTIPCRLHCGQWSLFLVHLPRDQVGTVTFVHSKEVYVPAPTAERDVLVHALTNYTGKHVELRPAWNMLRNHNSDYDSAFYLFENLHRIISNAQYFLTLAIDAREEVVLPPFCPKSMQQHVDELMGIRLKWRRFRLLELGNTVDTNMIYSTFSRQVPRLSRFDRTFASIVDKRINILDDLQACQEDLQRAGLPTGTLPSTGLIDGVDSPGSIERELGLRDASLVAHKQALEKELEKVDKKVQECFRCCNELEFIMGQLESISVR
ncbi:hypothetical protein F4779DRAFT_641947 [Xylariaceae sp. FL0662B]|nr:hypothetical protein F4779DRAFT_641947 [Xylariaceae sp. FL0662B]